MNHERWAIGIDLGGTKIDFAAVSESGKILNREHLLTHAEDGEKRVIEKITQTIEKFLNENRIDFAGVGIGVPGQVKDGIVKFAPNLEWHEVPIQDILQKQLQVPVVVINDVWAAAYGEKAFGNARNCRNFVCVMMGTGIGGVVFSEGEVFEGSTNSGGEIGHMTIDLNGPSCTCGNWGCFEAVASGWALARNAQKALMMESEKGNILRQLVEEKELSAKVVIEAYRKEDELAIIIINEWIQATIAGCVSIVNGFNPERLLVGGGLIQGFPEMIELVNAGIRERALASATEFLQVLPFKLKSDAGVIGASNLVLN